MQPIPSSSGSSDPPIADDMVRLNWSKYSVYNTIISSEDNEIMYQVSTPTIWSLTKSVTTITKFDKSSEQKVIVGEIHWKVLNQRTQVRIGGQNCEWMHVWEWLKNPNGISTARTFTAEQGIQYRWKFRKFDYHLTTAESPLEGRNPSLAIFHQPWMTLKGLSPTYLEVSSSVLRSLDYIIVALLIMEKVQQDASATA